MDLLSFIVWPLVSLLIPLNNQFHKIIEGFVVFITAIVYFYRMMTVFSCTPFSAYIRNIFIFWKVKLLFNNYIAYTVCNLKSSLKLLLSYRRHTLVALFCCEILLEDMLCVF